MFLDLGFRAKGQSNGGHGSSHPVAFAATRNTIAGMGREVRRAWVIARAAALTALFLAGPASGEVQKRPIGPLQEAIYGFAVAEYCGLVTPAVAEGFYLKRDWIVVRDRIGPDRERADRMAANMAADWQYGDHGLGGYRGWCRTEGLAAAYGFLHFREAMLGK